MLLLDGRLVSRILRSQLAEQVAAKVAAGSRPPALAVILVGDDPASQVYVRNKQKACAETGIRSLCRFLPDDTTQDNLLEIIGELNEDPEIDGVLLQLPLPRHLDRDQCLAAIDPIKDVDGFHPLNMGKLALGLPGFVPCTPAGILKILQYYNLSLEGKHAVVVGRSAIVGKPLAMLLSSRTANATVTLCHSRTVDLAGVCRSADFLFVAMGCPDAITGSMVKQGAVVIDVGISRTPQGLRGDVNFDEVAAKAHALTPVPGGIGPMTIAMLLANTMKAQALGEAAPCCGQPFIS